jgi:hypothetical protein
MEHHFFRLPLNVVSSLDVVQLRTSFMKTQLPRTAPHSRSPELTPKRPTMRMVLGQIIESMRDELKLHGETLALLEQHEMLVTNRCFDSLLDSAIIVNRPIIAIRDLRSRRESSRRELARRLDLDDDTRLTAMTPLLPREYRILVEVLIKENLELANRVKQCVVRIPWCPAAWKIEAVAD